MTREEFESILEEAYIEGYNTALEDIEEDILDEEAYDLEGEYEYYNEALSTSDKENIRKYANGIKYLKDYGYHDKYSNRLREHIAATAKNRSKELANLEKIISSDDKKVKYAALERAKRHQNYANKMDNAEKRYNIKNYDKALKQNERDYLKNN